MKNEAQKNILFLALAGVLLVVLNVVVLMATKNGSLAPIENQLLWGAFVVLNVSSLLWAVSLLGLQPLVLAFSYLAGGFVAFLGVRLLPDVNVAEVTTAGATYGAFGVLAVGNATTKIRLAFFDKKQVPFIFVIAALLVLDGFLNSSVSGAGFGVILNALIFPFVFAGIIVGLLWTVLARFGIGHGLVSNVSEPIVELSQEEGVEAKTDQIMFKVPEATEETAVALNVSEPVQEKVIAAPEPILMEAAEEVSAPELQVEELLDEGNFFPLEIDKDDDIILLQEELESVAMLSEIVEMEEPEPIEIPEPVAEIEPIEAPAVLHEVELVAEEPSVVEVEPVTEAEKKKESAPDWLSGHMDLLNNIKKAS